MISKTIAVALILTPLPAMAGDLAADKDNYYKWCAGQGGTPSGYGSDMRCTPASNSSADTPADVGIEAWQAAWSALTHPPSDSANRTAAATANARAQGQMQSQQAADTELRLQSAVQHDRAEEDAKRGQMQTSLIAAPPRAHSS